MSLLLSVIVPAFREKENLRPLITRVFEALKNTEFEGKTELIVVDDNSNDGSQEVVTRLAQQDHLPCRIIIRTTERGLSSAVCRGFDEARGQCLLCMDADLQHPPERVPALATPVLSQPNLMSCGTRYVGSGAGVSENWPFYRRVVSWGARLMARPVAADMSDPMSGFFCVSRTCWQEGRVRVSAVGFKIAMECRVKLRVKQCVDVPIHFAERTAGQSKLTGAVIVSYVKHLNQLYNFKYGPYFYATLLLLVILAFYLASKILRTIV